MIGGPFDTGRGEPDVHDFVDEMTVLSRWLDRDLPGGRTEEPAAVLPVWTVFRFRDAAVFESEQPDGAQRMYLVRGDAVREFVVSQGTIDEAYAQLSAGGPLPAAA